ncbi:hypothetical protein, variant [Aphanomyces invadans]|uniref:Uncharacterized protein n=1 Tax=Aphanomyces invadans TaxID=157072 RepID=A0A024TYI6_9STRA|nr:hypothetical protein, variant [Aphanomyces invadans]ETV99078.1 hypothetical protein, variant [Aphanomyces invadans]|eukprot:XP_008872505.1 hypothetical protein, variant [Aphanomyces invadans]
MAAATSSGDDHHRMHSMWLTQRTVHGHTATFKDMALNLPRNAAKGVHNFLGLEDRRFLHAEGSHGLLPRCQVRDSPLEIVRAIQFGDVDTVAAALASTHSTPRQTNSGGETLLHIAVLHQEHRIVQLLLEHGADVHARTCWRPLPPSQNHVPLQYAFTTASGGATPLHLACSLSNVAAAKALLAAGAQTEIGENELCGTPLVWAVCAADKPLEMVRLLLAAGASPDCRDLEDNSVVAIAVMWWVDPAHATRLYQLVAALVQAGVDVNHKNVCGWTAFDVAATDAAKAMLRRVFRAASGRCVEIERTANVERERDEGRPWLRPLKSPPPAPPIENDDLCAIPTLTTVKNSIR